MTKLEDALIDKLTSHPDVRDKARALLRAVHSRTGPGTGYDIGEGKTGIPAICAFIASKRFASFLYAFFNLSILLIADNMRQCWLRGYHRRYRTEGVLSCTQDICEHVSDSQNRAQRPEDAE
jgi:hypothetical protein